MSLDVQARGLSSISRGKRSTGPLADRELPVYEGSSLVFASLNEDMLHNLRLLRVQAGMTLEQLALQSGLTRSYLSKVERGLSNPSIGAAMTIARALGIGVEQLFGQPSQEDPISVVRAKNGKAGDPRDYLSMVAGGPDRVMRAFVLRPGQRPGRARIMSHHDGEEIFFVLTGRIELQIGRRIEVLNPGDCVQFDSTIPHKVTALTSEAASALVVVVATDG